jgi:hypothetical protein
MFLAEKCGYVLLKVLLVHACTVGVSVDECLWKAEQV